MYALANVEKFVKDNAHRLGGGVAETIVERAKKVSQDGVFSGGAVEEIMQNKELAEEFHKTVMDDPEHIEIGLRAMRAAR